MPGEDWRQSIPEALRADPSIADFKSVEDLTKSFIETKKLVGSSLRPPSADAGPDAHKAFADDLVQKVPGVVYVPDDPAARLAVHGQLRKVLGVPDKPEEYTAPKDVQLLPTDLSALQARAAALGLTKSQFEQEAKAYAEGRDKVTSVRAEAQAALRVELGAAFAERTALVAAAASKLGFPPALVADLKNGAVDMPTYKAFSAIAKSFSEGGQAALQMDGGGAGSSQTPAELEQAMAEIRANPAYRESSPRGRLLQAKHRELAEKRWG